MDSRVSIEKVCHALDSLNNTNYRQANADFKAMLKFSFAN